MSLSDRVNDNNAAPWVIEEIKKLEAERDELRKLAYIGEHLHEDCSWKFRFSELKAERDALAAHVDRLRLAALNAIFVMPGGAAKAEIRDAYDETPETSLAKRDAEQQKIGAASFRHEVMESVKTPFRPHIQGVFEAWLRRQAGGGEE